MSESTSDRLEAARRDRTATILSIIAILALLFAAHWFASWGGFALGIGILCLIGLRGPKRG